jgi:hypothetical protein
VKLIRTECYIDHPPAAVWAVLADFGAYADWNPLNIRADGHASVGAKVRMTFLNPARPGTTIDQTVTITACEPEHRLAWSGRVPLLFTGEHSFELAPEDRGTHLIHSERLSGLVTLGFSDARLARDFVPHYEATNLALAARVAELAGSPAA